MGIPAVDLQRSNLNEGQPCSRRFFSVAEVLLTSDFVWDYFLRRMDPRVDETVGSPLSRRRRPRAAPGLLVLHLGSAALSGGP